MYKEDCFYLGKIISKHSFKGQVLAKLDTNEPQKYQTMESVFVSLRNELVPFFIDHCRLHKPHLLRIAFEGVNDEAAAEKLLGADLYLPLTLLPPLTGNNFYFHEVIGFTVIDEVHGTIGTLKAIYENTPQELFEVEQEGKHLLIPVHDDIILRVDRKDRVIYVKTPKGLVELYWGM